MNEYSSYRGIWAAVLLQTLADLRPNKFPTDPPKIDPNKTRKENARRLRIIRKKREMTKKIYIANMAYARRWLASNSRKPATFLWVCDCLGLDPEVFREFARDPEAIEMLLAGKLK